MSTSVVLPALGESVTEGTVTRWLKKVGDTVQADEGLLEISTDKVDTEIPSPVTGVIEEILVQEDETVEVGAILAKIGDGSSAPAETPARLPPRPSPLLRPLRPAPEPAPPPSLLLPPSAAPAAEEPAAPLPRRRSVRWQGGPPPRARRERHRGHDHPLAQAGRRPGRGRRAAPRDLDRQGRHRDPLAVQRCAPGDPGEGGRDGRGRHRARPCRRRRCRLRAEPAAAARARRPPLLPHRAAEAPRRARCCGSGRAGSGCRSPGTRSGCRLPLPPRRAAGALAPAAPAPQAAEEADGPDLRHSARPPTRAAAGRRSRQA